MLETSLPASYMSKRVNSREEEGARGKGDIPLWVVLQLQVSEWESSARQYMSPYFFCIKRRLLCISRLYIRDDQISCL